VTRFSMITSKTIRRFLPLIVRLILLFALVFGGYVAISMTHKGNVYSAVFLDNGQVYFGEIKKPLGAYTTLSNVYYFGRQNSGDDEDVSLVKLGSELHGPTDNMEINRDHILFIEELEEDSRVMEAIQEYEDND